MSLLEKPTLAFEECPNDTVSRRVFRKEYMDAAYTERLRSSLIALISIFLLPMFSRT